MFLLLSLIACAPTPEAPLKTGTWHSWLESPGGPLPFELDLKQRAGRWTATIHNGTERIGVDDVSLADGVVTLRLLPYEGVLRGELGEDGITGTWTKPKPEGRTDELPWHATFGEAPRFEPLRVLGEPASIAGRWTVAFEDGPAVGIFEQEGTQVTGTFLTPLGDYRFLAGSMEGDQLRLSAFDGAHAFLFTATLRDGTLAGDFWSGSTWHETWTATLDPQAKLPDPSDLTRVDEQVDWSALSFPDLDGRSRSLADPEWADSPRLVQIMGSWCPNCNDQTELLVELYDEHRASGLQIVSIAFEHDPKAAVPALRRYRGHHGVAWTTLIGGLSAKDEASKAVPILDRVRAYPTLLFVDRTGAVRGIRTGFTGPAAPREHAELRAAYDRQIDALLSG